MDEPGVFPPVQSRIMLGQAVARRDPAVPFFFSRILRHYRDQAFLDAPRTPWGEVADFSPHAGELLQCWWGDGKGVWCYPVEVMEVLEPVPVLQVRSVAAAQFMDRRREPRQRMAISGWATFVKSGRKLCVPVQTRDVSPSALRFSSPMRIAVHTTVCMELQMPGRQVSGTFAVRTCRRANDPPLEPRWEVVARWESPRTSGLSANPVY